eukprot:CAMPEP_0206574534 /NCGR_PEP_ID=MMETSP0325_2-20121206/29507_1 /ASSEMBLY_ACC=CAM_ASM_000347 /TAXON_ID=2866 /ORGANISM="Crypthecodinium cohnii, Strain Seligo" /LENGTH=187 /DNA_ID=CAMNT_0054079165 /DNA_START=161 /DNA_END=725 /DNA_ORIENTATION=+
MSAPPWADAKLAVYNAFRDVWFVKNIRVFLMPPTGERACEALCQDLLFNMTREAGLLGVKPNHPWSDFASDFQYPDHPEDRIVSNIQRYAGNYLIVITLFALISSLAVSPGFFIFLIVLHCIPLFGPPEMFDVLLNLPASWGGLGIAAASASDSEFSGSRRRYFGNRGTPALWDARLLPKAIPHDDS